jgi:hypothetical protein
MARRPSPPAAAPAAQPAMVSAVDPVPKGGPSFGQPVPTPDPGVFRTPHPSDNGVYKIIDGLQKLGEIKPLAFPASRGGTEPVLTLDQVLGGTNTSATITANGQMAFHSVGDTGNVSKPTPQSEVADKMTSDFDGEAAAAVPQFLFHLGDQVYNFSESQYWYDQFYEPYRDYPAPILAVAGNHEGNVIPNTTAMSLANYLANFCATGFETTPEAGGLDRTAQIQPGVYFTFDAPFIRILALYSGSLEDPGIISSQGGTAPTLSDVQLDFLRAALTRIKTEKYAGAVVIVTHHPPFTTPAVHSGSPMMLADIDAICAATGVWPHAHLSAHVHNYQRFTRTVHGRQIPYIIAGNGGHGIQKLAVKGSTIRTPVSVAGQPAGQTLVFESYDDVNYGYLRLLVTPAQLRIEYHPASDGSSTKTPDDSVTIDLASGTLVHYEPAPVAGAPAAPVKHHAPKHGKGKGKGRR